MAVGVKCQQYRLIIFEHDDILLPGYVNPWKLVNPTGIPYLQDISPGSLVAPITVRLLFEFEKAPAEDDNCRALGKPWRRLEGGSELVTRGMYFYSGHVKKNTLSFGERLK
jgi:hypothetical protein